MKMNETAIEIEKATVAFEEGDVVIRIKPDAELDLRDLKAINSAKNELVGDGFYTVLFIPHDFASIDDDARRFSATKEVYHNAIAKAIVVRTLATRLIGTAFLKVNRPPGPTKLFKTEVEAKRWLATMRKKYLLKN